MKLAYMGRCRAGRLGQDAFQRRLVTTWGEGYGLFYDEMAGGNKVSDWHFPLSLPSNGYPWFYGGVLKGRNWRESVAAFYWKIGGGLDGVFASLRLV